MNLIRILGRQANKLLRIYGFEIKRISPKFYLHQYSSYDEYKQIQIYHNKRKLDHVWADANTLNTVAERIKKEFGEVKHLFAICHGTRNGFEQNYLIQQLNATIIGTDISDTALQFENSIQWDFHDENMEWEEKCDFIYSNSLDQSYKPQKALSVWLSQLKQDGLLFIEHTQDHGPGSAGEMDPFGAEPTFMPYLLVEWFGHQISIEVIHTNKSNKKIPVWLYVIRKRQTMTAYPPLNE